MYVTHQVLPEVPPKENRTYRDRPSYLLKIPPGDSDPNAQRK